MIDTGSSTDLLYYNAFKHMDIIETKLNPVEGPIKEVKKNPTYRVSRIILAVKLVLALIPSLKMWSSL